MDPTRVLTRMVSWEARLYYLLSWILYGILVLSVPILLVFLAISMARLILARDGLHGVKLSIRWKVPPLRRATLVVKR